MLACFALAALAAATVSEIPARAEEVRAEARALLDIARSEAPVLDDRFYAELEAFSGDALLLSQALREAGVPADLPCIFKGIGEDARLRATEIRNSDGALRTMAVNGLSALLQDAIEIAPMARDEALAAAR